MDSLRGRPVSAAVEEGIKERLVRLYEKNLVPTVAIVRVGDDPGNIAYENGAVNKANMVGVQVEKYTCPADMEEDDLISVIESVNKDGKIHGILILQPLPSHIDGERVRNAIAMEKDIDCISDRSLGRFFVEGRGYGPCTAESCMEILNYYGVDISGKRAAVIGRSMVIGRPAALMLTRENATVTLCHSRTPRETLARVCREADIIVSAAGRIGTVTEDMMTENQVIIDVGINFDDEGRMEGDADYAAAEKICRGATPVPGGVGSVTTAILMRHLVDAAEEQMEKSR